MGKAVLTQFFNHTINISSSLLNVWRDCYSLGGDFIRLLATPQPVRLTILHSVYSLNLDIRFFLHSFLLVNHVGNKGC